MNSSDFSPLTSSEGTLDLQDIQEHLDLSQEPFHPLSKVIGDLGRLELLITIDNLRRRLWFKAIQPVEEVHQNFQAVLLGILHCFLHFRHIHVLHRLELDVFLLERNRVINLQPMGGFEDV